MSTPHADSGPVSRPRSAQPVPVASTPAAGDTLAERYHLDRESRRTEAGVVFAATDEAASRHVTVEIATSLEEPEARRRWARDARIAQRLEGEHVLRVLDVGNAEGDLPFAVREPAISSLAAEIDARGALPLAQAVGWTLEACEAVAEAHALGMAHGDLRLDNVYLARGVSELTVKVAWTTAAKAERAAKEDVQRDIAGLGAMLRVLATGHTDVEADGAPTLPTDVAHAVARALTEDASDGFHNVAELARELAPFAPPGNSSARTIAFLLSRAGIVGGAIPGATADGAPRSSRRSARLAAVGPTAQATTDRLSFPEEWFGRAERPRRSLVGSGKRSLAFLFVSLFLVGAALGGTWLLWRNGKPPVDDPEPGPSLQDRSPAH